MLGAFSSLQWRHNEHDGVSNYRPHDWLLKRLFRRRSKKTPKLCVTGLCVGNWPVTGQFPAQRASNAENVSIWWRHDVFWRRWLKRLLLWLLPHLPGTDVASPSPTDQAVIYIYHSPHLLRTWLVFQYESFSIIFRGHELCGPATLPINMKEPYIRRINQFPISLFCSICH